MRTNPQPDTLQKNSSDQREKSGHSQRHSSDGQETSQLATEARTRGKRPQSVETEQRAPGAASLAKLAFKEEEKKWSMFTEKQNLSLLLQSHSKRTVKDVFYCRKKQNDLKGRK